MAELALLLTIAAVIGMIARFLRQPMILAYLLVGGIVSAFGLVQLHGGPMYRIFADLGITFLLFLAGLEINITSLRRVGPAAVILGLGQIVITFVGGFFICLLLGLAIVPAAYIALALTFSSTVIVVKLLSERQDLNSLYGKLSLGILLVQDIAAIVALVVLAGMQPGETLHLAPVLFTLGQAAILFGFVFWLGRTIMPKIFAQFAHTEELLFMTSLAWVFLLSAGVQRLGFSIEIGGFLAGIALANSSTHYQIASRVRPLRDFFIALFFIILGSTLVISHLSGLAGPIVILSLFVLIGNPIIVLVIMGVMGYHRRTSFLTGVAVAQISEFSLVLGALGVKLGHIADLDLGIITAVGVITIATSSYMITYSEPLYRWMDPVLRFFHRGTMPLEPVDRSPFDRPIILVGAHRMGQSIARNLPRERLLIIDADPDVVANLKRHRFHTLFGDSADQDLLNAVSFQRVTLVISTMPNLDDNLNLLSYLQLHPARRKRHVVMRADNDLDAALLYERGANYVLQPLLSTGQYFGRMLRQDPTYRVLERLRRHDQQLSRQTAWE